MRPVGIHAGSYDDDDDDGDDDLHVSHTRPHDVRRQPPQVHMRISRDVTITGSVSMKSITEMAGRLVSSPLTGLLLPAGSTDVDVWLVSSPLTGLLLPAGSTDVDVWLVSSPLTGLLLPAGSTDVDVWLVSTLPLDGRRPVPEATARHAFLTDLSIFE